MLISILHSGICFQFYKTFGAQNDIIFQRIATIFSLTSLFFHFISILCALCVFFLRFFSLHVKENWTTTAPKTKTFLRKREKELTNKTKMKRRFQIDLPNVWMVVSKWMYVFDAFILLYIFPFFCCIFLPIWMPAQLAFCYLFLVRILLSSFKA